MKDTPKSQNLKKVGIAIFIPDNIEDKMNITKDNEDHFKMIKVNSFRRQNNSKCVCIEYQKYKTHKGKTDRTEGIKQTSIQIQSETSTFLLVTGRTGTAEIQQR